MEAKKNHMIAVTHKQDDRKELWIQTEKSKHG